VKERKGYETPFLSAFFQTGRAKPSASTQGEGEGRGAPYQGEYILEKVLVPIDVRGLSSTLRGEWTFRGQERYSVVGRRKERNTRVFFTKKVCHLQLSGPSVGSTERGVYEGEKE